MFKNNGLGFIGVLSLSLALLSFSCLTTDIPADTNAVTEPFTLDAVRESDYRTVGADDSNLAYDGRIDMANRAAPVLIWEGTQVSMKFTGKSLGIVMGNSAGRNYFNVVVDGRIEILGRIASGERRVYMLANPLTPGSHEVVLFKRTEASMGHVSFRGFLVDKDSTVGPRGADLPLLIEFIGDSITAGACDEDKGEDQWDDLSTHNNYTSYAAITARAIRAEYSNVSISGTGLCYSWNPLMMLDIYDKLYPDAGSAKYDASKDTPGIVVINLGQNDYGYPQSRGMGFPADFSEKYVTLVRGVRAMYPDAKIVCAIGGMSGYRSSPDLQSAFSVALDTLKDDPRVYSYVFEFYTNNHPRNDAHRIPAKELVAFLEGEVIGT